MKLQHPLFFHVAGMSATWAINRLVGSSRIHCRFLDPAANPSVAIQSGKRYIYAFYHENWLLPAYIWGAPEIQVLVSTSRDGDLSAQIMRRLGFSVVRGSSNKGGARALREMIRRVGHGNLCLTPDGPRGPRRQVQLGLVYLASRSGLPIVGMGLAYDNPWRTRTWDQFAIPRPFRTATCIFDKPIEVPRDADRETLENKRLEIQHRLDSATSEAEAWVAHLRQPRSPRMLVPHRKGPAQEVRRSA